MQGLPSCQVNSSHTSQSDTIASAYTDNPILQSLLNDKIPSRALTLPLPTWFSSLRLATKSLSLPSVDATICHALAQNAMKILEGRQIKASAQEEVEAAHEEAQTALEASQLEADKRLYRSRATENIWRKHVVKTKELCRNTEDRINVLQETHYQGMVSLGKRLDSLEGKLQKAQDDDDDAAVKNLGNDVRKARDEEQKLERKRVALLDTDYDLLQARELRLRAENDKLEIKLVEAQTNGYVLDTERVLELKGEMEGLRSEFDAKKEVFQQLDKQHAELEVKHAILQGAHAALQKKYVKKTTILDTVMEKARAQTKARDDREAAAAAAAAAAEAAAVYGDSMVVVVGQAAAANGDSTLVAQGKKRALLEEDEMRKRARLATEALQEVAVAGGPAMEFPGEESVELEVRAENGDEVPVRS